MMKPGSLIAAAFASTLVACAGSGSVPAIHGGATSSAVAEIASKVHLTPKKATFAQGTTFPVRVSEKDYTGTFTAVSKGAGACKKIATWSPAKGKGPNYIVKIKGLYPGGCSIVFADAAKHKATLVVTVQPVPLDYIYGVNYASNDVSQVAFESDGSLKPIAPNYPLGSTCSGPNAIALDPAGDLAFIACYATGTVVALNVNAKDHTVGASSIAPQPAPSALSVIVPTTGAANTVYVDGSGQYTGSIDAFRYSSTALTPVATYSTPGSYPDEMALDTNGTASTLYVASGFDPETCTGPYTSGAVERWLQASDGSLTSQPSFAVCSIFYNLVVQNGNLFWAGPSQWGGFSLSNGTPLTMPPAPWAQFKGAGYEPDAMNVVTVGSPAPEAAGVLPGYGGTYANSVSAGDGNLYLNTYGGKTVTIPMASGTPSGGGNCTYFSVGLYLGSYDSKVRVSWLCWYFSNDDLIVVGQTSDGVTRTLWTIPIGNQPTGMTVQGMRTM